jgi:calmodulin
MPQALTQTMVRELEEAFFLFDYDKDGKITTREVGAAVRSVGLNPTELELKAIINDVTGIGGTVDVQTLCQIIPKHVKDLKTSPEELKDAIAVFDKQGNGQIAVHDLKMSLTTLGERLTDEELDELIREVDTDGEGTVRADDIVRVLLV